MGREGGEDEGRGMEGRRGRRGSVPLLQANTNGQVQRYYFRTPGLSRLKKWVVICM